MVSPRSRSPREIRGAEHPRGRSAGSDLCGIPRTARTCGRGDRRLDRHECRGHLSHPRQPLLGRASGEWLDGTAHAGRGGRAVRARRPRSAGEGQAAGAAAPPGEFAHCGHASSCGCTAVSSYGSALSRVSSRPAPRSRYRRARRSLRTGTSPGWLYSLLPSHSAGWSPAGRSSRPLGRPQSSGSRAIPQRSRGSARSPWWWRC